jgi:hypothetical protein
MWRRSQWPRGLRRSSTAARLLRPLVRIPPGTRKLVCCECCVLSGTGLYNELITRPEESYRLWCVVVCDLETSWMRSPWPTGKLLCPKERKKENVLIKQRRHNRRRSVVQLCRFITSRSQATSMDNKNNVVVNNLSSWKLCFRNPPAEQ